MADIEEYLVLHNQSSKLFVSVAQAEAILAKVERARRALENVKQTNALH